MQGLTVSEEIISYERLSKLKPKEENMRIFI